MLVLLGLLTGLLLDLGLGFGQAVRELALRHHQLPFDLPSDAQPCAFRPLLDSAGFEFTLGAVRYRYSRLGLERLKAESSDGP